MDFAFVVDFSWPSHPSFRGAPKARTRNPENGLAVLYYVYLLASHKNGTLYLGVTRDLVRRTYEHKQKIVPGFTKRYGIARLVWFKCYDDPLNAIAREKEIKKWRREWKIELIEKANAEWHDLYPEIVG
jgi:putative endonuclease